MKVKARLSRFYFRKVIYKDMYKIYNKHKFTNNI